MEVVEIGDAKCEQLIQEMQQDPPVVLAGSAISCFCRTSLPTGIEFTKALLELVFPERFLDTIDPSVRPLLKKSEEAIIFEVLLNYFPNVDRATSIMKKVFSTDKFNAVHEILAKALEAGKIAALITPNYDLCLDACLSKLQGGFVRIVEQSDFDRVRAEVRDAKVYFKIHGSADDISGEPPVFTLSRESLLPPWKRDALREIVRSRSLLTLGYSGSDFEICFELMNISSEFKRLFFTRRPPKIGKREKSLSLNAQRLLEQKQKGNNSYVLKTNIEQLLERLTGEVCGEVKEGDSKEVLLSVTSEFASKPDEIKTWRASILPTLAFQKLAQTESKNLVQSLPQSNDLRPIVEKTKAESLFHMGKYKSSALEFQRLASEAKSPIIQAESLMHACNAWRNYGNLKESYRCLNASHSVVGTLLEDDEQRRKQKERLLGWEHIRRGQQLLRSIIIANTIGKVLEKLKLAPLSYSQYMRAQSIQKQASFHFKTAMEYTAKAGDWSTYYDVPQWAESIGIERAELARVLGHPLPPPSEEGQRLVSYGVAEFVIFRHKLMHQKGLLTPAQHSDLNELSDKAWLLGNYPEVWKLFWSEWRRMGMVRGLRALARGRLWSSFWRCEYTIVIRMGRLLIGGG